MPTLLRDRLLVTAALLLLHLPAWGQSLPPTEHRRLAREILQELVEINTVHDSGATRAATVLARRFTKAGFAPEDVQLAGPKPHKQNLVVRLPGHGKAKPILFLAHLDVVEARREDWSLDPFTLTERDGYFYGRGTLDIKGEAADLVANLLRLKAEGFVPQRDIIVALTDDEEGGDDNGVSWLLQDRPELIRAAYVINTDAGGGQMKDGRRLRNPVQTSEKTYATYVLEVTGPGGHSSLPPRDNTIYTLARGLERLSQFDFPVRLTSTTRAFFRRLAEQESGQVSRDLQAVSADSPDPKAAAGLAGIPLYNSSMRTTCVATMLRAGHAENALPQRAEAVIQCRLLPGDSPEDIQATLIRVLSDSLIRVTLPNRPEVSPASPLLPEVMTAVERVTAGMWPGVVVLPVMDPWSSDGARLRRAGVPVYGVSGIFMDIDDIRSHGKDERIGVQAFYEGVEFMYRLMKDLAGPIRVQGSITGPAGGQEFLGGPVSPGPLLEDMRRIRNERREPRLPPAR
jgi:acetylornithine deacetylase/succinyl-diaminopimelate desuccinylase-like protein